MENVISLTQQLITIPSYVDKATNEIALAVWLERYIAKALPWLSTTRQYLDNKSGRFNLIASDSYPAKLVFLSHMDTVLPSSQSQLQPTAQGGKLYGRGSSDMKGGLAASLMAALTIGKTKGLTLIFDCDEEYYFYGIKKLLSTTSLSPKLVICPEPTGLEIINGCRGLIELECTVRGETAHAGRPQLGINAIEKSVELVGQLKIELQKKDSKELGGTTVNLAYLQGGIRSNGRIKKQPNAVPDLARFTLDIRTANPKTDIKELMKKYPEISYTIKLNYPAYLIGKKSLGPVETAQKQIAGKTLYKDLSQTGFYETALISNAWDCPAISLGPTGTPHASDEYVTIDSLERSRQMYQLLIKSYCL